jgi:hypothetical protein
MYQPITDKGRPMICMTASICALLYGSFGLSSDIKIQGIGYQQKLNWYFLLTGTSAEEWLANHHFRHDAANGPHVCPLIENGNLKTIK